MIKKQNYMIVYSIDMNFIEITTELRLVLVVVGLDQLGFGELPCHCTPRFEWLQ